MCAVPSLLSFVAAVSSSTAAEINDCPVRPGIICVEFNLQSADMHSASLSRVDFSMSNLSGAKLQQANLFRADLDKTNLDNASLTGARLDEADLTRASPVRARLDQASLVGANLHSADLNGATMRQANLRGASLSGAHLLERADLSGTRTDSATPRRRPQGRKRAMSACEAPTSPARRRRARISRVSTSRLFRMPRHGGADATLIAATAAASVQRALAHA